MRVTYGDINLRDYGGELISVEGQFCSVKWDKNQFITKEYLPNLVDIEEGKPLKFESLKIINNKLIESPYILAANYFYSGIDQSKAWSQFVIDRSLRPEIDAKQFYKIFHEIENEALKIFKPL
jgi:hypothetical protein